MRAWLVEQQDKMDCLGTSVERCWLLLFFWDNYEMLYVCILYDIHSEMECKLNTLTGYYNPMSIFIYTTIARQCRTF